MQVFRLETTLQSNVTPGNPGLPITMAYAFPPGSLIHFGIYDTGTYPAGTTPPEVTSVKIDCAKANTTDGDSPFLTTPDNPHSQNQYWVNKSSVTAKPLATPWNRNSPWPNVTSMGQSVSLACNVSARLWDVGPFFANKNGAYEFTVTVELSNGRTFMVDPEMVVGDGN